MFDVRYHVASLVAVFCALAIGLLIGVGLGDRGVVSQAQSRLVDNLRTSAARADERANAAAQQSEALRDYADATFEPLVAGRLAGTEVAIAAVGPLDDEAESTLVKTLAAAGSRTSAVVEIEVPDDFGAVVSRARADVRAAVDTQTWNALRSGELASGRDDPRAVIASDDVSPRSIGVRLGRELAGESGPVIGPADGVQAPEIERARVGAASRRHLWPLVEDGLVLSRRGRVGARVDAILVTMTSTSPRSRELLEGLVEGLRDGSRTTLVGVGTNAGASASGSDGAAADSAGTRTLAALDLTTVDGIETVPGRVALVYALTGRSGNFGIGPSARRVVPPLTGPTVGG